MTVLRGAGPADGDGFDGTWLGLRAEADDLARSTVLLERLARRLPTRPHLLDLGCGTGAMQRWCSSRLRLVPRWTLLDPDPALVAVAARLAPAGTRTLRRAVADLQVPDLAGVDAVVCSALLDVLGADDLAHLVAVLGEAGVPLLAALTVTGEVTLDPAHPDDRRARSAVDRTATADGATGPAALPALRAAAHRLGAAVEEVATPWRLDPGSDPGLLGAWAEGYLAAAVVSDPGLGGWEADRRDDLGARRLRAVVGHADVLVVPG